MNANHKPIVVTGAKGQLGGELCRMLGRRAVGLDIDSLDLTSREAVIEQMLEIEPGIIINCAAYTQVDKAETEPELARAVNAGAVESLAEACRRLDCLLVQISTDYVFGEGGNLQPWTEDDLPSPQGVYARTKLEGELAAAKWEKHIIVRSCGLYARPSEENAKNFVKTILRLADTKPELRVVNDQHCTPSYVPHIAKAALLLANVDLSPNSAGRSMGKPAPSGIYHVTNGGATTWHAFAVEILRLAGKKVPVIPITTAEFAAPAARPAYSVLDIGKYQNWAGIEMPSWEAGLKEYFEASSK
jgi:dTDP-4-dehydrorhamnose reductase